MTCGVSGRKTVLALSGTYATESAIKPQLSSATLHPPLTPSLGYILYHVQLLEHPYQKTAYCLENQPSGCIEITTHETSDPICSDSLSWSSHPSCPQSRTSSCARSLQWDTDNIEHVADGAHSDNFLVQFDRPRSKFRRPGVRWPFVRCGMECSLVIMRPKPKRVPVGWCCNRKA